MDIEVFSREITVSATYDIRPLHDGVQVMIRFANGYGLSVARHGYSYGGNAGLWEAAPIHYTEDGFRHWEFVGMRDGIRGFDYDDVKGWLNMEDVDIIAREVSAL